jgi:3-oxoacid CoA-transferase A subunit
MNKVHTSAAEAIAGIGEGAVVAIGGFFTAGVPRTLLEALSEANVRGLTLACGSGPLLGAKEIARKMIANNQIRKIIDSYALPRSMSAGMSDPLENKVRDNEIELEIFPMGTLAEKYRAAGAGIPAFYTPAGVGTLAAEGRISNRIDSPRAGKETRSFNGRACLLEYALHCDFALIHAYRGDREGNLQYRKTARNFNPVMAMAARVTIVEVENLVDPGAIDPEEVHTPGIYVQRIVQVPRAAYKVGME